MIGRLAIMLVALLPEATAVASPQMRVFAESGNIVLERGAARTRLTSSGRDSDPVLSPTRTFVVFTRQTNPSRDYSPGEGCETAAGDELRRIGVDGSGESVLLRGRIGTPKSQLCVFSDKQFNSDGQRLYFLTRGWALEEALHVYSFRTHVSGFVRAASDVMVLRSCQGRYKDALVLLEHRYFVFGGSYDWYWVYDATGTRELGPLGESAHAAEQECEDLQ